MCGAARLRFDQDDVRFAQEPISLETPIGEEEDSHLGDFIEDRMAVSPADAVISVNLKEYTSQVLRTLTPREERVIKMRFGLEDGSEHTLEEVGQSFQVTRERIRQIEPKVPRKLRHPSRSPTMKALVDGQRYLIVIESNKKRPRAIAASFSFIPRLNSSFRNDYRSTG